MVISGNQSLSSAAIPGAWPLSLALNLPDHMAHRDDDDDDENEDEGRSFSTRARALRLRRLNPRMVMRDEVRWTGAEGDLAGDWVGSDWVRLGTGADARELEEEDGRGGTGGGCSTR
jgi:hypothetical protein